MSIKKATTTFLLLAVSSTVLAHGGHGGDAGIGHDLEHMLWSLAAVGVVVAAGVAMMRKKTR
ncbi:hypothetical protein HBA55_24745 [Pseudomaricurvus alkylphenolicus]|uniref:hypothetical protein n=1 Tax=Pseudomaricurvus alkylphenolicus TaxID=1306991 RepID=UPI00141E0B35|nr:hypothetical protein [Pseudomaricurvus alkylphenolicus]NIB42838.1 hypothetical protein [Pseudomaricurvus alkylphenolicus]